MRVGIQSRGLPHLAPFFPEWDIRLLSRWWPDTTGIEALAGWGHKRSGRRTQAWARRRNLPYIALEDGFVRSYDLGVRGAKPWSLVVDRVGIYYDATGPSELEELIAQSVVPPETEGLMARMREHKISKYNSGGFAKPRPAGTYRLLIDQCMGDASVPLGMASEDSFQQMLAEATASGERLVVKTHPDVISGAREGYLAGKALPPGTEVIADDINPYLLFEGATAVHTVTSLIGMEALIAGRKVICHGAPFYAGWGLTEDRALPASVAARRTARPSLAQLFAAAYLHYARYIDPYSGGLSNLSETIDRILWLRAHYADRPARVHGWGFSRWKQPHVTPFLLPPGGSITFHKTLEKAAVAAKADGAPLALWAAKEPAEAAGFGVPLLRVEDGFIRSRGLGSDLIAADSLAVDAEGIYFDATAPSRLERLLETTEFDAELLQRAAALRQHIVANAVSKYNLGGDPLPDLPAGKTVHLVVGQVESDASIKRGGTSIRSNAALLDAVRAAHPDGWILYKPHPDVLAGNRAAGEADRHAPQADQLVGHVALPALLGRVDYLHTITSLSGFEMLLRGGKVVTYGQPFYAGWGLTDDKAGPFPRRSRSLSVDALVAAAIILYPRYYDWNANLPTTPERIVAAMGQTPVRPASGLRQLARFRRWSGL
jgi:capsular polysaccharide export protein